MTCAKYLTILGVCFLTQIHSDTVIFNDGHRSTGGQRLMAEGRSFPNAGSTLSQRQTSNSPRIFSVPRAILTLALEFGSCQSNSRSDCSSNLVFSPLSIASALNMLLLGTEGDTYKQLRTALGYDSGAEDEAIHSAFKVILQRMAHLDAAAGSALILDVANGLFLKKSAQYVPSYVEKAKNFYESGIFQVDFARNSYESTDAINKWISQKTNGKITNVLTSLPADTDLVLANAVYFNAAWEDPFPSDTTRIDDFYVTSTQTIPAPMMLRHAEVPYVDSYDLRCKMIAIPYKGEKIGMYILLPTEKDGLSALNALESKLSADILEELFNQMEVKTVSVQLPKFRIQRKLYLKSMLKDIGVVKLFSASSAELGRMTTSNSLGVDNIIHQTYIEVTESGTEAAAATVISLSRDGPSKNFVANQPFIFFIRDISSQTILFWGRMVRPETTRS